MFNDVLQRFHDKHHMAQVMGGSFDGAMWCIPDSVCAYHHVGRENYSWDADGACWRFDGYRLPEDSTRAQ